jgi:two-component system chemotaxis sensor kinase CheA
VTRSLDVDEFLYGYLSEADELLAAANAHLLALDAAAGQDQSDHRVVRELFRSMHTLKGLSAMVGADPIVDLAHEMESVLREADRAGGRLPDRAVDLLLSGVKAIEERVGALRTGQVPAAAPAALLQAIANLQVAPELIEIGGDFDLEPELAGKLSAAEKQQLRQGIAGGRRALRAEFVPSAERAREGLTITSIRARVAKMGEIVKVLPRAIPPVGDQPGGVAFVLVVLTDGTNDALAEAAVTSPGEVRAIQSAAPAVVELDVEPLAKVDPRQGGVRDYVRVEVRRLDDALERLSDLVITRSRLRRAVGELASAGVNVRALAVILGENDRQLKHLRSAIMRARMVPAAEALERAPLLVRGLSKSSGKQVRLELETGHAELDKSVAERIFPAIVHLLRNAVDHAIEMPEVRRAHGKPEEGRIRIVCREHGGNQLELTVEDDGAGIDRVRVAAKAGARVPESDAELLDLITRPGLSTMGAVTQTSGRGMGMDIVRRVVAELGGRLELRTREGEGTTFRMLVPLSITIVEAFSFVCGDEVFAVPVGVVDELADLESAQVVDPPEAHHRQGRARLLKHRGAVLPLFRLSAVLGLPAHETPRPKAMVVSLDAQPFAFEVERMIGQQEIVVRPLEDPLVDVAGVSGSTDLGDGKPTLVLDLIGLARKIAASGAHPR